MLIYSHLIVGPTHSLSRLNWDWCGAMRQQPDKNKIRVERWSKTRTIEVKVNKNKGCTIQQLVNFRGCGRRAKDAFPWWLARWHAERLVVVGRCVKQAVVCSMWILPWRYMYTLMVGSIVLMYLNGLSVLLEICGWHAGNMLATCCRAEVNYAKLDVERVCFFD